MTSDTPPGIDTREYVEALLVEMDKRYQERFAAQEKIVDAALAAIRETGSASETVNRQWREQANEWRGAMTDLSREQFSRREGETLATEIASIRSDHVTRREFAVLKDERQKVTDDLYSQLSEARGRRAGLIAAAAIIATLLSLLGGVLVNSSPSNQEVISLVKTNAPWLDDRPAVERRLSALESSDQAIRLRVANVEAIDRFFCRTRTPKLPDC